MRKSVGAILIDTAIPVITLAIMNLNTIHVTSVIKLSLN